MLGLNWKLRHGRIVQIQDDTIVSSDDEKNRRKHMLQQVSCEVRPSSSGDHCPHEVRALGCANQCCGRAGAGSKVTEAQILETRLPTDPIRDGGYTATEQRDIKAQLDRPNIDCLFLRQQVEQNSADCTPIKHVRYMAVPRAVAATTAAMSKQH